jgi:Holliday junction resolvase YEN1
MILVALMSGGDYSEGIKGCGPIISRRLAEAGYGRKLLNGIKRLAKEETEVQEEFLQSWREEVAEVLKTDPDKILDRKSPSLAKKLLELYDFPDRNIVKNYAHPKISRVGTQKPLKWSQDIDIGGLVRYASDKFEWGNEELVATFRNNLWAGVLLRQLRRSALAQDQGSRLASSGALVESVHDFKNEGSTDFTPSYRLHLNSTAFDNLIDPHLPHPDPFPIPDYDFYTQEDADLLRAERKSEGRKVKKPPVPGTSDFRHWIPAAFISVDKDLRNKVRDWKEGKDKKEREKEDKEEKKAERARAKAEGRKSPVKRTSTKSKKNAGGAGKKSAEDEEEEDEEDMLEVTAKLRKEKFAEQRKKEKEQERAAKAAAEKGAKIKGKGKAKEEVLTKSTKSARPPPSPSSSSDIEILPNPSTSRLRANKSASPSTSNLLNSFAPTKSSLPNRTTRKSPPASSTLLFNASKSTVTLPPKRPNRPAPSSDSESDSPQTFSTSSKHVDKSKRRSKAHTSPSKPKLQSSLIELSSSTSSDSDLDSLETILTTKEKARLSQEGRRTDSNGSMKKLGASSSQSSLAASSSSLASSSSKGKGNAKEKKKEKAHEVEVMVLSD